MNILSTNSKKKKFERAELRLTEYTIQLTGALVPTTLGMTP